MSVEIKVPALGESVSTATVARWLKKAGEAVAADEPLVELETDKVTVEVPAPSAGMLGEIQADEGAEVEVGSVLALLEAGGSSSASKPQEAAVKSSGGVSAPPAPRGPVSRPAAPPPSTSFEPTASASPHPAMPSAA